LTPSSSAGSRERAGTRRGMKATTAAAPRFEGYGFSKDKITQLVTGTDAFAKSLEAKVAALKVAL
jgi:hypothetical protein